MSTQRIMDSEFGLTREFDPPTALQVALQRHRAKLLPLGGVLVLLVVVCAMIGLVAHDRKQYTTLSDRLREAEAFHRRKHVTFDAHRTSNHVVSDGGATVVFDHVHHNVGDAYDATSGNFTAPYRGLYRFVVLYSGAQSDHDDSGERHDGNDVQNEPGCVEPCLAVRVATVAGTFELVRTDDAHVIRHDNVPVKVLVDVVVLDVGDVVNVETLRRNDSAPGPTLHVLGDDNAFGGSLAVPTLDSDVTR